MVDRFAAGFGLLSLAIVWMEDGVFPDRDLLWSLSDFRCYATDWVVMGIEVKDACKLVYIEFTGIVDPIKSITGFLTCSYLRLGFCLAFLLLCLYGVLSE